MCSTWIKIYFLSVNWLTAITHIITLLIYRNQYENRRCKFKSNARETWCVILVSASWHLLFRITALYTPFRSAQNHCLPDNVRPRGAFISVGDWTPTEKYLLLLTTCRSGSLNSDWDEFDKLFEVCSTRNFRVIYFIIFAFYDSFTSLPVICSGLNSRQSTRTREFVSSCSR